MAKNMQIGTTTQDKATVRQAMNEPSKKIKKYPIAVNMAADASKMPRIDVSQISPVYASDADSFNPVPSPTIANAI